MKEKIKKIVITRSTVVLAVLTIIVLMASNHYGRKEIYSHLSAIENRQNLNELQSPEFKSIMMKYWAVGLVTALFPFFWAWQNYVEHKKIWIYAIAIPPVMLGMQAKVAMATLFLYMVIVAIKIMEQQQAVGPPNKSL